MTTAITPRKSYQLLMFIWWAMLVSLGIYLAVCRIADVRIRPETTAMPLELIRNILLAVSVMELAAAGFFMRRMVKAAETGSTDFQKLSAVFIVSFAIAESVAIYGMVLYFLGDAENTLYLFLILSAAALVWFKPDRELFDTMTLKEKRRT